MNNPFNLHFARLHIPHCTWKYHLGVPFCTLQASLWSSTLHFARLQASLQRKHCKEQDSVVGRLITCNNLHLNQNGQLQSTPTCFTEENLFRGQSWERIKNIGFMICPSICVLNLWGLQKRRVLWRNCQTMKSLHRNNTRHPKVTKILFQSETPQN